MSEKICPLYKKALIEGLVSYFGDNSAVDEYVKYETQKPAIIACDGARCSAYRSYFHEDERAIAIVEYCGLAGKEII